MDMFTLELMTVTAALLLGFLVGLLLSRLLP